jgi:hypothetical protein
MRHRDRETIFSPDRKYRYSLWRTWDETLPYVVFIGLNPSTADETKDDPTIRRCVGFAKRWGYGAVCVVNLFGYRATNPAEMKKVSDPFGRDHAQVTLNVCREAGLIVAAWGVHGSHRNADELLLLGVHKDVHCLGTTKDDFPCHPLYLRSDLEPVLYLPKVPL